MAEKAAQTQTAQRTFRKASREQVSMKKDMKGVVEGTFRGFVTKEIKDKTNRGYRDWETDRKSTRLNSSHSAKSRMPSSA